MKDNLNAMEMAYHLCLIALSSIFRKNADWHIAPVIRLLSIRRSESQLKSQQSSNKIETVAIFTATVLDFSILDDKFQMNITLVSILYCQTALKLSYKNLQNHKATITVTNFNTNNHLVKKGHFGGLFIYFKNQKRR